jgi:1,4-alpha-glucan branching enzyme
MGFPITSRLEKCPPSRDSGIRNRDKEERTLQPAPSEFDLYLLAEGTHYCAYEKLGAHLTERDGRHGVQFAVWAPRAKLFSVIGDPNKWIPAASIMRPGDTGIGEGFVPDIGQGERRHGKTARQCTGSALVQRRDHL